MFNKISNKQYIQKIVKSLKRWMKVETASSQNISLYKSIINK